jgi:hypothetical protein
MAGAAGRHSVEASARSVPMKGRRVRRKSEHAERRGLADERDAKERAELLGLEPPVSLGARAVGQPHRQRPRSLGDPAELVALRRLGGGGR